MKGHIRHLHKGPCPPRCRNPASWQAIVYAGRDPITGAKRQKTATRKGKRNAEAALAELIGRYGGKGHAPAELTVAELLERWLPETRLSPTTRRRTRSIIDRSIVPYLGRVRIARLDGGQLDALYTHLEAHGRKCNVCWSRIGRSLPALRDGERYATSAPATARARCGAPTPKGPCRKWPRKHATRCERHGGTATDRPLDRVHRGDCVAGLPAAPATIRRVHTTLRSALGWAAKRKRWLDANPAEQADPPAAKRSKARPPTREDVARLLEAAQRDDSDAALEWLCWLRLDTVTGARRGEVCAVKWHDIDWDGAAVVMEHSIALDTDPHGRPVLDAAGRRRLVRKETKADTAKRPELDAATLALLASWRHRQAARALGVGLELAADAYVFSPDVQGRTPWPPDTMTQRFRRLRARAGLERATIKDLRHWAASNMLLGGIDLVRAAARTGHDSKTLLAFYAHYLGGGREAADLLADLVDRPSAGNYAG